MARSCALTVRSGAVELPPGVSGNTVLPLKFLELLTAESGDDAWRLVELSSADGLPFEVEVGWSAGGGSGAAARLTVAHAARVALHARSLALRAANRSAAANHVTCTVADAYAATRNTYEHAATHLEATNPSRVPVPPFAERVRVELGALHPAARLRLRDGLGRLRAVVPLARQPADGLLVGGAASVELDLLADVDFRAVFPLAL